MKKIVNPFISSQQDIDIDINQNNKTEIINPLEVKFGYNKITVPNNLPNDLDKISFGVKKEPKKELTQIKINISKDESNNINNINDTSQISNTNIINQTQQPIYKPIEI